MGGGHNTLHLMCLNLHETLRVFAPSLVHLSLNEIRSFHPVSTTHRFSGNRFCPSLAAFPCAITEFSARILFLCSPFNICLGRSHAGPLSRSFPETLSLDQVRF